MCAALLKGEDVQVLMQAGGHAAAARQVGNCPCHQLWAHATRTTLAQQHKALSSYISAFPPSCVPILRFLHTLEYPNTSMRSFLALASPVLALFQTAISAPSHYDPVPYDQAPSYYPGAPWSFPRPANGRLTCTVVAPEYGGNSVPNILKAFQKCGKNGKVIFQDTTCKCSEPM
jgi:hypothetical protein